MTRSRDVADTQDNLGGAVAPFVAGKNKIINGDFGIWQRGTSFSFTSTGAYTSDRFLGGSGGGGTVAITRQTFTAGQTDVPNAVYFFQAAYSVSGTDTVILQQNIEDVNTLAGQVATFSFYAKVNSGTKSITPRLVQDFGSGGSSTVVTNLTAQTLTTSWQRFTITSTIPSVSGKTIGTSSYLRLDLLASPSGTLTYQIANLQLEAGSVATPFTTASGSIGGELALCKRYFERYTSAMPGQPAQIDVANRPEWVLNYTEKRVAPTITVNNPSAITWVSPTSAAGVTGGSFAGTLIGTLNVQAFLFFTVSSGISAYSFWVIDGGGAYSVDISAEL